MLMIAQSSLLYTSSGSVNADPKGRFVFESFTSYGAPLWFLRHNLSSIPTCHYFHLPDLSLVFDPDDLPSYSAQPPPPLLSSATSTSLASFPCPPCPPHFCLALPPYPCLDHELSFPVEHHRHGCLPRPLPRPAIFRAHPQMLLSHAPTPSNLLQSLPSPVPYIPTPPTHALSPYQPPSRTLCFALLNFAAIRSPRCGYRPRRLSFRFVQAHGSRLPGIYPGILLLDVAYRQRILVFVD